MNFIEKIGVIMVLKKKKYIFFSLKKLGYWLNKGASLNNYVSFLITLLLFKRQQSLNAFSIKKNKK
jgi:ribosomal protein S16